jgi:hypothetical protein
MKTTDKGNFTQIELETSSGQANYLASLKSQIPGDRRSWQRDPETQEMNQFMADNRGVYQYVVKVGDVYTKI